MRPWYDARMIVPAALARELALPRVVPAAVRALLVTVVVATAALGQVSPRADVAAGLAATTRQQAFSIVGWEVAALTSAAAQTLRPPVVPTDEQARIALVREHFENTAEIGRLRQRRGELFERPADQRQGLAEIEASLARRQAAFDDGRVAVERVVGGQVEATLRELGLRRGLVTAAPGDGWPLPFARVTPGVFFTYQRLPLNLVVAPRDRVALVGSVLVSPDLETGAIERLESRVDGLGLSSLVSGIGGFGSFPSMIPDADSLRRGLDVIGHEWTHHYLLFQPLGRAFFTSYEMRTLNEMVADIVGKELGRATFERYYVSTEPATPPRASRPAAGRPRREPAAPDFGVEMRRIRREVERLLAIGDVPAAEAYMAAQQQELARIGFHVRKLNTAYLSFFGAYGGGGSRQEPPLRALRAASPSLAAFLARVERITSPEELARLS